MTTSGVDGQIGRGRPRWMLPVAVVALLAVVAVVVALVVSRGGELIEVDVPPGTAARIAAGEQIELLPRLLVVSVGDTLVIRNHDEVRHDIGPYTIAPGETLRQTFSSQGVVHGMCTLHHGGEVTIAVQ